MDPLKAFFSDETAVFRDPVFVKPNDMITIRLRAPLGLRIAPVLLNEYSEITMDLESENSRFSYYVCKMFVPEHNTHYGFKVVFDDRVYYYTRTGVKDFYDWGDCFDILPGFSIPDWAWGSIMYQIFPDRFCNGGKMNDVVNAESRKKKSVRGGELWQAVAETGAAAAAEAAAATAAAQGSAARSAPTRAAGAVAAATPRA